jgi:hypothetical protein
MRPPFAVLFLAVASCGRSGLLTDELPAADPPAAAPASIPPVAAATPACRVEVTSDFPGVTLEFPTQPCSFTEAQALAGIPFRYTLVVDQAVAPNLESLPSQRQSCPSPLSGAGVYVFEHVVGLNKETCLCDEGRCATPPTAQAVAGRTDVTWTWQGREWSGPSDFGNPLGAPFGPGAYSFQVEAQVSDARADMLPVWVRGKFFFTVAP